MEERFKKEYEIGPSGPSFRLLGYETGLDELHYVRYVRGDRLEIQFVDPETYDVNSGIEYTFEGGTNIQDKLEEHVDRKNWALLRKQVLEQDDEHRFSGSGKEEKSAVPGIPDELEDTTLDSFSENHREADGT